MGSGFSFKPAFWSNIASASLTIPGAAASLLAFSAIEGVVGIVLSVAASSFVYIAVVDLLPGLRQERELWTLPVQLGLIFLGVFAIVVAKAATSG